MLICFLHWTNSGAVMVKTWIAEGRHTMAEDERGAFVRRIDYAALQASHARLLGALNRVVQADDDQTLDGDDIESAREAIAAAQPFTEKTND